MLRFRGHQETLFKLCSDLRWKQTNMAGFLEITPQTLNRYWRGERELPRQLFEKILDEITDECLEKGLNMMGLEDRVKLLEEKLG